MKKRALIVTVGTGTRSDVQIFKPLKKAIEEYHTDFVWLAASSGSRSNAEIIVRELALATEDYAIALLSDIDDFQAVFQDINAVFQDLFSRGFAPDEIEIDFTSGTKAMSSGAVLAAIHNQCRSINYITGQRKDGVVIDGTEQFRKIRPAMVFAAYDLKRARDFILKLRFDTAEQLLHGLTLVDTRDQALAQQLRHIAEGYRLWDLFNHKGALAKLKHLDGTLKETAAFRPTPAAAKALEELAQGKTAPKDLLLIDLFNNAERRCHEGRYDDAVARLYRTTELLAQYVLERDFKIVSGDVDPIKIKVPDTMREGLERLRDKRDNKIKIGLDWDYRLLEGLGHDLGVSYTANESLQGQLRQRNQSILAHGLEPMTANMYRNLKASILSLIATSIPDFATRAAALQFPWLGDHKAGGDA